MVERFPGGVRVVLPSRRRVLSIIWFGLFIPYSLAFVGGILVVFGGVLLSAQHSFSSWPDNFWGFLISNIFFLIFLSFTLLLSGFSVYQFLWEIKGREIIEISNTKFSISRQLFRWKPTDEYNQKELKDLRAVSLGDMRFNHQIVFWQKIKRKYGNIAFDYGAKTYHFGEDIDEAEAKMIIAVLKEYLPHVPQP